VAEAKTYEQLMEMTRKADAAGDRDAAQRFYTRAQAVKDTKPVPEGLEVIAEYEGGGRVTRDADGNLSYRDSGYSVSGDNAKVREIMERKGDAGAVVKRGIAQDIADQAGAAGRAASLIKGVPFLGSYADELISMFSPEAAQATRMSQEAQEILSPTRTAIERGAVGLATAVPMALAAPAISLAPLGTSIGSRIVAGGLAGAGGGALEGAIYGAGEGRTLEERGASAMSGGQTGAVFGAGLGVAGPALGGILGSAAGRQIAAPAQETARQIGVKGQALDLLSKAAQMDAPVAGPAMARAGQYASLGQMGPATQNLLDLAASSTSEGAAIARANIDEVAGEAGEQMSRLLDTSFGGPQAAQQVEDVLMETTAPLRKEVYDRAYANIIDYSDPAAAKLEELMTRVDRPIIEAAERIMRREGQPSSQILAEFDAAGNVIGYNTLPDVRQIDYITRALHSVSPTAAPEDKNTSRALASQIRGALDELVSDYKTARGVAGDVISVRDALSIGSEALTTKMTRYDVKKALSGMTGPELSAVKQGVRSYIDEIMANAKASLTDPNQDAREMVRPLKDMMSRAGREKLETILGDQSKEFLRQMDEIYSVVSMRAGVAQNSKTAIRRMAQDAAEDVIQPTLGQLAGERGVVAGSLEALRRQATQTPSKQEAFQALMGEIAQPLTRQKDLTTLLREMSGLQQAAPQLERGRRAYETGKAAGTFGAVTLTPAMQTLLGQR
jgi:hypothetical protein